MDERVHFVKYFLIYENLLQRLPEFLCFGTYFELQFPIFHLFFRLIMNGSFVWTQLTFSADSCIYHAVSI